MPAAAIATLAVSAVLILALAFYLIRIILQLRELIKTLGLITFGLRAIAHRTEPVGEVVAAIEADTSAIDGALSALLESKMQQEAS
jgi:predicted PurR-regulated permease PerM